MDNSQRSLKVFLCHAHADRKPVRELYDRLIRDNIDAWLDKEKLIAGQDWQREIRKAVRESDVVVVCLSKQFNQGGFRQREVRLAIETALEQPEGEIFIIPARLEECDLPESLSTLHCVDLFESDGYQQLRRSLQTRATHLGITLQFKKSLMQLALQAKQNEKVPEKRIEVTETPGQESENARGGTGPGTATTEVSRKTAQRGPNTAITVALIGLIGTILAGLLGSPIVENWLVSATPTSTQTAQPSTQSPNPPISETSTAQVTSSVSSPTATLFTVGADNMPLILIPAGKFQMGSTGHAADERPVHTVYLDDYFIDQTEVTNAMYAVCVQSGKCEAPKDNTSFTRHPGRNSFYYGNPEYDNYPVIHVSWVDAKAYCRFVGRRLPTEAEWEKAASWDDAKDVQRIYPWGNSIDCTYANFYGGENKTQCEADTLPVGSYPKGASFYGVLDMAGNVAEWVLDRYDPKYYADSPEANPKGPPQGDNIVIRGGSFLIGSDNGIRSSDRELLPPGNTSQSVGFRCAIDATATP